MTKLALVTGASRGIGRAIATQLAEQTIQVIGTATTQAGADNISDYLQAMPTPGKGMVLDIANADSRTQLLEAIHADFGAPTILINNAGIRQDNLLLRMKADEWDAVLNTNLTSVFHLTKACLRGMIKARWGRIVNISSVVASSGNPGQANYVAAKAGLIGFSKSLALEIATRNITVNVVAPGFIETDMTSSLTDSQKEAILAQIPQQAMGSANDIAAAVNFLASDMAGYITGQTLHVNGGMYLN